MFVNIPQRSRLAQGHSRAARLDLPPDGLTYDGGHDARLVIPKLVVLPSKKLPQTRHDVTQKQVHGVVRQQLGPNFPKILERWVPCLVLGAWRKKREYPLKPSFWARVRTAAFLFPSLRAASTLATLAATLAAVRRGVVFPLTSKRGCFEGGGSLGSYGGW